MSASFYGKVSSSLFYNQSGNYISYSVNSNRTNNTVSVNYPANAIKNTLLLLFASRYSGNPTLASPWSLVSSANNINSGLGYTKCYYQVLTGSLSGHLTIPFSAGFMILFKNYKIFAASSVITNTSNSLSLTSVPGDLNLLFYGTRSDALFTPVNVTTELFDYSPKKTFSFGCSFLYGSGTRVITRNTSSNEYYGMTISLI